MVTKRLFIACPLPETYKKAIVQFQKQQPMHYRWIAPENWHITLLFLGDFPEDRIENLQEFLNGFFASQQPVVLIPKAFIFAPKLQKARMIWLRFYEETHYDQLCATLYEELESWYAGNNIPFNLQLHKRQIPHVTLARFKPVNAQNHLFLKSKNLVEDLPELTIHQASLFESIRKPEGAVYHNLGSFDFGRKLS